MTLETPICSFLILVHSSLPSPCAFTCCSFSDFRDWELRASLSNCPASVIYASVLHRFLPAMLSSVHRL